MPRASPGEILEILDQGARDFIFPMLDNGYTYLAAARLSLFTAPADWALVFETFGFSPRTGVPDLLVTAFASRPVRTTTGADYRSEDAFRAHLKLYANVEQSFFEPLASEGWIDPDDVERLAGDAATIDLRGFRVPLPGLQDYEAAGIELRDPLVPEVFEVTRALAFLHRDEVLATEWERRTNLIPELKPLLVLDDWHHPDVADPDVLPSQTETFRQLATVLSTSDPAHYDTTECPNTHWPNWPDGGTL